MIITGCVAAAVIAGGLLFFPIARFANLHGDEVGRTSRGTFFYRNHVPIILGIGTAAVLGAVGYAWWYRRQLQREVERHVAKMRGKQAAPGDTAP